MLTTLTVISIFTEIFAAGVLLAGVVSFLKKYASDKKIKDFLFGLFSLTLFIYVAETIASQLLVNRGEQIGGLILLHKGIHISLVLGAAILWGFMIERFELKKIRWTYAILVLAVLFFIFQILMASVNLVYREGIIEPIISFSLFVPAKLILALVFLLLAIAAFVFAGRESNGRRTLTLCLGISSVLFLLGLLSSLLYVVLAKASYLLLSWFLVLFSCLVFLLAELIPPESDEARHPFLFFRSRILFKLMLIFILLIVILFETTTLATINMSKQALSKAIIRDYLRVARDVAVEINIAPGRPSFEELQRLVSTTNLSGNRVSVIIDEAGRLLAHPDQNRALQQEGIIANQAVELALRGEVGGGEFYDELGSLMVGAYLPIKKYGWGVVVEEPIASAYSDLRELETNSLLFVIVGMILTVLVGIFFARSIERPIKDLTAGTEAVAAGNLSCRVAIASSDEIGRLAQAFNQMTKDLRESQERLVLSEKLASLGTMAAGMAHEIKNPLVSIRTFTQILQQKWEDKEFRDKFSSLIPHEIERINRIAESLLKFGKPVKPELSRVDLNAILEEVLLLFESETKKNSIRVTKKLAQLPAITGDAGQLQQVFVNVIKNSIEAMQSHGGELVVKSEVGEVKRLGKMNRQGKLVAGQMVWGEEEELAKPIPVVFLEVSDTGEGIPEKNLRSLFDPFFTTKMTGTGMGLPITLRIVEEHRGSIKVRSSLNKGTSFVITLPQA